MNKYYLQEVPEDDDLDISEEDTLEETEEVEEEDEETEELDDKDD